MASPSPPSSPTDDVLALRVALLESERARVATELALARVHGSRSWRLTAPLRTLAARLRHRRHGA